jgi:hypothetical protein
MINLYFQPACLKMLFVVPGATLSLDLPETVTRQSARFLCLIVDASCLISWLAMVLPES